MAAAGGMVILPMDFRFQPLFYNFEGILDDINDRLQNPNKLFGTWGSKKGPTASECMKGLGHLKVALELRPALYGQARMVAFQDHLAQKAEFDAAAQKLMESLNGIQINTPTIVGISPSVQHYFVRNVLAFLDAMQNFPACRRDKSERIANFFSNNPAEIAKFRADLQAYLDNYDKVTSKAAEAYGDRLRNIGVTATKAMMNAGRVAPLTTSSYNAAMASADKIQGLIGTAALKKYGTTVASQQYNSGLAARMPLPPTGPAGGGQGGGRRHLRRSHKNKSKKRATRHYRKSRRHQ